MDDKPNQDDFHKVPYDDFETKEIGWVVIVAVGMLLVIAALFILRLYRQ